MPIWQSHGFNPFPMVHYREEHVYQRDFNHQPVSAQGNIEQTKHRNRNNNTQTGPYLQYK